MVNTDFTAEIDLKKKIQLEVLALPDSPTWSCGCREEGGLCQIGTRGGEPMGEQKEELVAG